MTVKTETAVEKGLLDRESMNLALFLSGKSISLFGSAIYTFAMGLYLLRTTGSGVTFAINIVLYTLPLVLINPLAGVIADRIDKKKVVVGTDLLNGIFLLAVYILAARSGLSVFLIYFSTFIVTILATFFNIGIEAAKPNLVSRDKLVNINSIDRLIEAGSQVMGPVLGGVIYALVDIKLFILFNALSFLLAAVQEYFIDYQYSKGQSARGCQETESSGKNKHGKIGITEPEEGESLKGELRESLWDEMKEGYRYILSRPHMMALIYIFIALNFFFGYAVTVPLPYLLNEIWKIDSSIFGIIQAGLPVGMIVGALLVKSIMARISYSKLLRVLNCLAGTGALIFGIPLIFSSGRPDQIFILVYYTAMMFVCGLIMSWVDIPKNVLLQQIVPGEILGRVVSVMMSIGKIVMPAAVIVSGYLVNYISPLYLFLSGAAIFIIFTIWFFTSTAGREFVQVSNKNLDTN